MDLVSKLVPVTENLKPTAHFILVYRLKVAEPKVAEPKVAQTKGCQTKVAKPNCGPSALRGFLTGTTGT